MKAWVAVCTGLSAFLALASPAAATPEFDAAFRSRCASEISSYREAFMRQRNAASAIGALDSQIQIASQVGDYTPDQSQSLIGLQRERKLRAQRMDEIAGRLEVTNADMLICGATLSQEMAQQLQKRPAQQAAIPQQQENDRQMIENAKAGVRRQLCELQRKNGLPCAEDAPPPTRNRRTALNAPGPGSASSGTAQRQAAPAKPPEKKKVVGVPAHKCLALDKSGDYGGFINNCDFTVRFTFCAEDPKPGSDASYADCAKFKAGSDGLAGAEPHTRHGDFVKSAKHIYWFACQDPSRPKAITYRPHEGLWGSCG